MSSRSLSAHSTRASWRARLRHAYYGWWVLATAVFMMAVGEGIAFSSFGLFVEPLETEFGWARAEVALGFSISLLVAGATAPAIGRAIDRFGTRRLIVAGTIGTGLSFLLLATVSSLWEWYLFLAINAVVRQAIAFIPFQVLIARWFAKRRATAVAVLGTGLWLGSVVMVPIMAVVIDALAWDGAFVFAAVLIPLLFVPLAVFILRDDPPPGADEIAPVTVPRDPGDRAGAPAGLSLTAAFHTRMFWVLTVAITAFFYSVIGWMVHAVPYYESVGLSEGWAAGLVSITSAGAIVALLVYGRYADRFGRVERPSVWFSLLLTAAMGLLLVSGGAAWGIALFILLFALGFAAGPLLEPLVFSRAFGLASYGTILGASFTLQAIGLIAAPAVAGAIFDAADSYDWALVMFASSAVVAALGFLLASHLAPPVDELGSRTT